MTKEVINELHETTALIQEVIYELNSVCKRYVSQLNAEIEVLEEMKRESVIDESLLTSDIEYRLDNRIENCRNMAEYLEYMKAELSGWEDDILC